MLFLLHVSLAFDLFFLIFSVVLLLRKSCIKRANNLLAITFMLISAWGFYVQLLYSDHSLAYHFYPVVFFIIMALGPSIYFYVRQLLGLSIIIKRSVWAHALSILPVVACTVYILTHSVDDKVQSLSEIPLIFIILLYIQFFFYMVLCFYMERKQRKKSHFIEINGKLTDISWLPYFFGLLLFLLFVKYIVYNFIDCSDRVIALTTILMIDALFLYLFVKSVWHTGLFMQTVVDPPKSKEPVLKIAQEVTDTYLQTLLIQIEQDKIYLKEGCTIDDVAQSTGISRHHLSYVLNTRLHKTFHDFINDYRIRYAKILLADTSRECFTIEAIGLDCGFGCKETFNRAFKKHTGITPSKYRQEHHSSSQKGSVQS